MFVLLSLVFPGDRFIFIFILFFIGGGGDVTKVAGDCVEHYLLIMEHYLLISGTLSVDQ